MDESTAPNALPMTRQSLAAEESNKSLTVSRRILPITEDECSINIQEGEGKDDEISATIHNNELTNSNIPDDSCSIDSSSSRSNVYVNTAADGTAKFHDVFFLGKY